LLIVYNQDIVSRHHLIFSWLFWRWSF